MNKLEFKMIDILKRLKHDYHAIEVKSEFEAVLKISPDEVLKKMDKALGRTKIQEN